MCLLLHIPFYEHQALQARELRLPAFISGRTTGMPKKIVKDGCARNMVSRHRVSADPVDILVVAITLWYERHIITYQTDETFSAQVWAFKDAWNLHKLITLFRPKVVRPEKPRDPWIYRYNSCFNDVDRLLRSPAS